MTDKNWEPTRLPASEWRIGDYLRVDGVARMITGIAQVSERTLEVEVGGWTDLGRVPINYTATIGRVPSVK